MLCASQINRRSTSRKRTAVNRPGDSIILPDSNNACHTYLPCPDTFPAVPSNKVGKKYHAFRKVWSHNEFPVATQGYNSNSGGLHQLSSRQYQSKSVTLSWKCWPPPLMPLPGGLKIPVQINKNFCTELATGVSAEKLDIEPTFTYEPAEELTPGASRSNGMLNAPESEILTVHPASVTFTNPNIGDTYTATIKVRNNGSIPRRMGVLNPKNSCFEIDWGASVGETTLLAPGLTNRILLKFRPKTMEAINDLITILIDDDGAIVVPLIAQSASIPILEMEEFDVGCSNIGNSRISNFTITNLGATGRFWFLTEEQFKNEYIELRGPKGGPPDGQKFQKSRQNLQGSELSCKGTPVDPNNRPLSGPEGACQRRALRTMLKKLDHLMCPPFRIFPACFRVQKNQTISIQIKFKPKAGEYYFQKLALLCHNGQVHWVAVKGFGIDPHKFPLVTLKGDWSAPPVDLPADVHARVVLDSGDLLAGERTSQCFTVTNNSCMSLYFFWCVRWLRTGPKSFPPHHDDDHSSGYGSEFLQSQSSGFDEPVEWSDYEEDMAAGCNNNSQMEPLKISPARGILRGKATMEFKISLQVPAKEGYHSSVLSFFVEQMVGDQFEEMLKPIMSRELCADGNEYPILYEALVKGLFPRGELRDETQEVQEQSKTLEKVENDTTESLVRDDDPSSKPTVDELGKTKVQRIQTTRVNGSRNFKSLDLPPFFYVADKEDAEGFLEPELKQLEFLEEEILLKTFPTMVALDLNDVNSNDGLKTYKKYFGKHLQLPNLDLDPAHDPETCKDPQISIRNGSAGTHRMNSQEAENLGGMRTGISKEIREIRTKDWLLAQKMKAERFWLGIKSPLHPVNEVEVWVRTVPLQCGFEPPFISACGDYGGKTERHVKFTNHSHRSIFLSLEPVVSPIGSIICWPYEVSVSPSATVNIRFKFQFRRRGTCEGRLGGVIKVENTDLKVPCWLPFNIRSEGTRVELMTPLIDFGLILPGTEHVRTIALKNFGPLRTEWRARILEGPEILEDDIQNQDPSSPGACSFQNYKLIRNWPDRGTIEPDQMVAIQIYLSAPPSTRPIQLSRACEVTVVENGNEKLYVMILAHIMPPQVVLYPSLLTLGEAFKTVPNYDLKATLQNLTALPATFCWLQPIGPQSEFVKLRASPPQGVIQSGGSVTCQFEFISPFCFVLEQLFIPCGIEGMREPLIAKLEGTVMGICLKIEIPRTRMIDIPGGSFPWNGRDQVGSFPFLLCAFPQDEMSGEEKEDEPFVSYVGSHLNAYLRAQKSTPPPPPTASEEIESTLVEDGDQESQSSATISPSTPPPEINKTRGKKVKVEKMTKSQRKKEARARASTKPSSKSLKKIIRKKPKSQTDAELEDKSIQLNSDENEEDEGIRSGVGEEYEGEKDYMVQNPNVAPSFGRLINFQISKPGETSTVTIRITNESPLRTEFKFCVARFPASDDDPADQQFILLDDAGFEALKNSYREKVNLLRGKYGCVFHVSPSEGILYGGEILGIDVSFLANAPGVFEDYLECSGLEERYCIDLIGLAIFDGENYPSQSIEDLMRETMMQAA